MPYLSRERRLELLSGSTPETSGDLNYLICNLIEDFVIDKGISYAVMAEAISGATEAVAEFRRRIVSPYEDLKLEENGEVFDRLVAELKTFKAN